MNSPMRYIGSKNRLAKDILQLAPKHHAFVDVFGGSAAMIFQKSPELSKIEIYNDADNYLVTFFRVLRSQAAELQQLCFNTPYAREEFFACRDGITEAGISDLERARRVFVTYRQNFGGRHASSFGLCYEHNRPLTFANVVDDLLIASKRLRFVCLENLDFGKLIEQYGLLGNLLYCDPPYLPDTRNSQSDDCYCTDDVVCERCSIYRREFPISEHERFLETITKTPAMAIVSGYASELYEDYLHTWKCYSKSVTISLARVQADGKRPRKNEMVWINNACEIALKEQRQ